MERIQDVLRSSFDKLDEGEKSWKAGWFARLRCFLFGHRVDAEFDHRIAFSFLHDGHHHIGGEDGGPRFRWKVEKKIEWRTHRCVRCGMLYLDAPRVVE